MNLSPISALKHPCVAWMSLLAAILIGALWIGTNHRTRLASLAWRGRYFVIRSDAGRICLERLTTDASATARQGGWDLVFADYTRESLSMIPEDRSLSNGFGFKYWSWNLTLKGYPISFARLTIPFWPMMVLFLAAPGLSLLRYAKSQMRRTRQARGLCIHCGYDLRATKERCPECGHKSDQR